MDFRSASVRFRFPALHRGFFYFSNKRYIGVYLPVSKGGTHARDNRMSLCQSCQAKIHHDLSDR